MKKTFLFTIFAFFVSTVCFGFSVPDAGKLKPAVISYIVPVAVPSPRAAASGLQKPLPTNKWFNSIINNPYGGQYSLRMYTLPQVFRCYSGIDDYDGATWAYKYSRGLMISYPQIKYASSGKEISFGNLLPSNGYYPFNIKVSGYRSISGSDFIPFDVDNDIKLESFSDFSATVKWEKTWGNVLYSMKTTIGQGFVFSYFEYNENTYPAIEFAYKLDNKTDKNYYGKVFLYKHDGTPVDSATTLDTDNSDRIILETRFDENTSTERSVFYGVFVPTGTVFKQTDDDVATEGLEFKRIFLELPSGEKYFSVGLLPSSNIEGAKDDLALYYKYAYNFVTDTSVEWEVTSDYSSKTTFTFVAEPKRTDIEDRQDGTLFCLLPHQYNNLSSSQNNVFENKTFDTLRGTLNLAKGNGFSTQTSFYGIVPFFQYNEKELKNIRSKLEGDNGYLKTDNNSTTIADVPKNTYHGGKVLAKLANMLPVADNLNNTVIKNSIIIKLKNLLEDWFNYSSAKTSKYFAYDSTWGGLIGMTNSYGSEQYNDHHFHYGYFIYTAAILAMYDEDFKNNYKEMVELLIKDIANSVRTDESFPYMRCFDFYESHSWANGMGGGSDTGIDQESSSEAMNAWSAIYLWGLATNNEEYKKLGIYLYSNEYEAIKHYYFNINGDILKSPYAYKSVGILWGGLSNYDLHFDDRDDDGTIIYPKRPQKIKGMQIFPLTPSMTYLAYDKDYIEKNFYQPSLTEPNSDTKCWYDIWARLVALYDPSTALTNFDNNSETVSAEEGSSKSFTYHFINFFKSYGTPVFNYKADVPSYMVLDNNGTKTFCAYNCENASKNIHFYLNGEDKGYLTVPSKSFASTQKLSGNTTSEKISVYPVPFKPNSGGKYGGDGIYFDGVKDGTNIKIFNIAGEKVFEKTVSDSNELFVWDAKNNAGSNIASGIYIYYIKTSDGKKVKGKLAIER